MKTRVEKQIAGRMLSLETGHLAKQANCSIVAQYGETVVLASIVAAPDTRGVDFFPLSVEYREKQYSAGNIPGSIFRREGRPSPKEVLTCRLIDRPMRPLFPSDYHAEVQIHVFVLSADKDNDPDVLAMVAASAAAAASDIPWNGPVASTRVGLVDDEFVINPTHAEREVSEMDIVVSSTSKAIAMVEGEAKILPEEDVLTAIDCAHDINVEILDLIGELVEKAGKPKCEYEPFNNPAAALEKMGDAWYQRFLDAHHVTPKLERQQAIRDLKAEAVETFCNPEDENAVSKGEMSNAFGVFEDRAMREDIVKTSRRADGRDMTEIRALSSEVGLLPRAHGSAVFTRGETQALVVTTLGTVQDELRVLDPLIETPNRKFMLHYNFPPFSVGEVRPARGTSRRDIGHGNLAERAIEPVLPDKERFPYTIRIVSEILESNGSSSQATICGATLALMDAGVPIADPVAGIAMGMLRTNDRDYILTDIAGAEDHHGDMDLKIAGTQHGITALQMDLKVEGVSTETLEQAFEQAREARMQILRHMLTTLETPRADISPYAPRLVHVKIDPEYIGKLIGPGGKNIKALEEKYGVTIEVEDDGTVTVSSSEQSGAAACAEYIGYMGRRAEVGKIYDGTVIDIKDFGAIVELFPGSDGLCHISQLSSDYVKDVRDVCKVGDKMQVKVLSIEDNRVRLSRKAALEELGQDE